ncbi:hypothetical protein [Pseudoalteromonas sp. SCQQ13]|uniref:hypothetical protein n=1 Tax=Pseudoalteromonas sp. SCQQ13 TaxID=2792066 RepID=UPI0018CD4B3A|nr:hypothetical protein [Pseudoalteromonas sp. SCQQ13]MBH0093509.1 hypothetical protein [Pseudoalteromonas sp. SCQQ13]
MTKKALIISGIFWHDTWQRHQNIATALIEQGYNIDFVAGVKSSGLTLHKCINVLKSKLASSQHVNAHSTLNNKPKQLNEISAFNLPYEGELTSRAVRKITPKLNNDYDIIICYIPAPLSLKIIAAVNYKTLIYDCVRNFAQWPGIAPAVLSSEQKLITIANQIWVDSFYLFNQLNTKHNKVAQILPTINKELQVKKQSKAKIQKLAFFGSVSSHFDTAVLNTCKKLGIELYIWGKDELQLSQQYSFVHYQGYESNESRLLNSIITNTDGIIIPYKGCMDGVIPAKIMQSLSTYLPVFISSFYDSQQLTDYLYCYRNQQDLELQLAGFNFVEHNKKSAAIKVFVASNTQEALKNKLHTLINNEHKLGS